MDSSIRITYPHLTVGHPPTSQTLRQLKQEGFASILNLTPINSQPVDLDPATERNQARRLGLEYLHLPVSRDNPRAAQVDLFRSELARLPKPVYLHADDPDLAAAYASMHAAAQQNVSAKGLDEQADRWDLSRAPAALRDLVAAYVGTSRVRLRPEA